MDHLSFYAQVVGIFLGAVAVAGVLIALLTREPFDEDALDEKRPEGE